MARFRTAHRTANASSSAAGNFRSGGDVATRISTLFLLSTANDTNSAIRAATFHQRCTTSPNNAPRQRKCVPSHDPRIFPSFDASVARAEDLIAFEPIIFFDEEKLALFFCGR